MKRLAANWWAIPTVAAIIWLAFVVGRAEAVTFAEQIVLALALIAIVGLILMRKKPPESR